MDELRHFIVESTRRVVLSQVVDRPAPSAAAVGVTVPSSTVLSYAGCDILGSALQKTAARGVALSIVIGGVANALKREVALRLFKMSTHQTT